MVAGERVVSVADVTQAPCARADPRARTPPGREARSGASAVVARPMDPADAVSAAGGSGGASSISTSAAGSAKANRRAGRGAAKNTPACAAMDAVRSSARAAAELGWITMRSFFVKTWIGVARVPTIVFTKPRLPTDAALGEEDEEYRVIQRSRPLAAHDSRRAVGLRLPHRVRGATGRTRASQDRGDACGRRHALARFSVCPSRSRHITLIARAAWTRLAFRQTPARRADRRNAARHAAIGRER